jgi:bifunctional UDP-N-acetylglucosamine pyrophosphorylase/glucosamine-1-phosphate N-acetyltransferase
MKRLAVIILAAGMGKRMKSKRVKVLHHLSGSPMLRYTVGLAKDLKSEKVIVVIGHQSEEVKNVFQREGIDFCLQEKQLGTGDAVRCTREVLKKFSGTVLILCGDAPLIKRETVKRLIESHHASRSKVTLLTTCMANPAGYGRVVRDKKGRVVRIVEEKDASEREKRIPEINTGIYCMEADFLFRALPRIRKENAQAEYYLTDVVSMAVRERKKVSALVVGDPDEVMGINDRVDLAKADRIMRERINTELMRGGVTIIDPDVTYIDKGVEIGKDTVIYPNSVIQGNTIIGESCLIESGSMIVDSEIGSNVVVRSCSIITKSRIKDQASIGPFAHLRPETHLEEGVKIGNFVEVKKSKIGKGSKASHLSYIGDTTMGEGVNVGAGTITCNYDGKKKHPTYIEDRVFIGSDTQLIAPVTIGKDSLIGAGSTITRNVPPYSLAVSRSKQINYKKVFHKKGEKKG